MRVHRRAAGVSTILAAVLIVGTALGASPTKMAKFKGLASGKVTFAVTFTGKEPLSFTTSRNGKALLNFIYTDKVCGIAASNVVNLGTIKLGSGAIFNVSNHGTGPAPDSLMDGGKVKWVTTVSGKFPSAKMATGSLTYTASGVGKNKARCGPIRLKFTARTR